MAILRSGMSSILWRNRGFCCCSQLKNCYNIEKLIYCRKYSGRKSNSSISKFDESRATGEVSTSFAEVVKENTKSAWYLSVVIGGIGVTALMFYAIFRELFSSTSPNNIYTKAFEKCANDGRIIEALGEPIKAFGEESRRGRRGHVNHQIFYVNEKLNIRMHFYIQGVRNQATVYLQVYENSEGKMDYLYLIVQVNDIYRSVIVLEDNRGSQPDPNKPILSLDFSE